ncbi:MAG: signal recognition particle receptor subunit alpha, partial [Blastocatellia bacterium]
MPFWKRKKEEYITLGLNRAATPEEEAIARQPLPEEDPNTFFDRFRTAVSSTRESLSQRLDAIFAGKHKIDAEVLDRLEEVLIGADIGVQTALEVIEKARQAASKDQLKDVDELRQLVKSELGSILQNAERNRKRGTVASETEVSSDVKPYVLM